MKAVVIHSYGGPEVLVSENRSQPIPKSNEILIKVAASSVNPFDYKIRSGSVKDRVPLMFPAILGFDVSGVVQGLGDEVTSFAVGDKVFAQGAQTYAEFCVVKAAQAVKLVAGLDLIEVAALPTVTTTGAQLGDLAVAGRNNSLVLVTGALGNVGRSAVYAAKSQGATVIAGVLKRQLSEALASGADQAVALDDDDAMKSLKTLDAVADTVGGAAAEFLVGKIRAGGTFATVLAIPKSADQFPGVEARAFQVTPNAESLMKMAVALQQGKLSIPLGERFSMWDAAKAHAAAESGAKGKLLLVI
jgi:NADPH:quinone reductase-like Zn-dependent oxidoreductase